MSFRLPSVIGFVTGHHQAVERRIAVQPERGEQLAELPSLADAGEDSEPPGPSMPPSDAALITDAAEAIDASSLSSRSSKELCQKRSDLPRHRLLRIAQVFHFPRPARRMPAIWSASMWLTIIELDLQRRPGVELALLAGSASRRGLSASLYTPGGPPSITASRGCFFVPKCRSRRIAVLRAQRFEDQHRALSFKRIAGRGETSSIPAPWK